ncbi:GFA domain-containing protein [Mycena kentingensis (nom. inval.)]|nr:GFA domain-containing protein [Mycena kentingensis (nom. inval.)]
MHNGSCRCGLVSFKVEDKPLFSVYCHCTKCQRADGAAFVSTMHFPSSAFSFTYDSAKVEPLVEAVSDGAMTLYRCPTCRSCPAIQITRTTNWALRGTNLARDDAGKIIDWDSVKPTSHIFYNTRIVDVADDLPKWEGFPGRSNRLD